MKTTTTKKLKLSKNILRNLTDREMEIAVGGAMNNSNASRCWASGCTCIPPVTF